MLSCTLQSQMRNKSLRIKELKKNFMKGVEHDSSLEGQEEQKGGHFK